MRLKIYCFESIDCARDRQAREDTRGRRWTCFWLILLAFLVLLLLRQVAVSGGWGSIL